MRVNDGGNVVALVKGSILSITKTQLQTNKKHLSLPIHLFTLLNI